MDSDMLYEVKGPKSLFEMTWEEVADALRRTDAVIVPVGSTEQHGPHLPLGSDTIQGTDLARRVVARLAEKGMNIVAAPTIPFGISHAHMRFPGTITLSSATLIAVLYDVCSSLYCHGFRKFALLLSHGGNLATLRLAAGDLAQDIPDAKFIVPDWLPIMYARYTEILKSDRPNDEHHSGEAETARLLASTPRVVEMERAKAYYVEDKRDPYLKKPYAGSVTVAEGAVDMKELTPNGVMGDPRYAESETGEKLYEIATDWLCEVIEYEFFSKVVQEK